MSQTAAVGVGHGHEASTETAATQLHAAFEQILERIDAMAQFNGPEAEAKVRADLISTEIARFEDATRLAVLPSTLDETSPTPIHTEQYTERALLARRRLRRAQALAREQRARKWIADRKELLSAPRTAEDERNALFSGRNVGEKASTGSYDDQVVTTSESITSSLRRLHQMAQGEIIKSELNIEEVDASGRALSELANRYGAMDLLLNGSKRLVQILDAADAQDRRLMMASLSFLAAVLVWVIYRRILALPLRLLFWSITRTLWVLLWFIPKRASTPAAVPALVTPASVVPASDFTSLQAEPVPKVSSAGGDAPGAKAPVETTVIDAVEPEHEVPAFVEVTLSHEPPVTAEEPVEHMEL